MLDKRSYRFASGQPSAAGSLVGVFGPSHPLAQVAADHCSPDHIRQTPRSVACAECWERAIRNDERIVGEFGLPAEQTPDPAHVDEIAVQRASQGEPVALTAVEVVMTVTRLQAQGLVPTEIGRRLGCDPELVRRVLGALTALVPETTHAAPRVRRSGGEAA